MKRIGDVLTDNPADRQPVKPADLEGQELVLEGFSFKNGQFGRYAMMDLKDEETDVTYICSFGGTCLNAQLKALKDTEELPLAVSFQKIGNTYVLV